MCVSVRVRVCVCLRVCVWVQEEQNEDAVEGVKAEEVPTKEDAEKDASEADRLLKIKQVRTT